MIFYLPEETQVGSVPLHWPSDWQVRSKLPINRNPILQLYSAVEPNVVPAAIETDPPAGFPNSPQSTTAVKMSKITFKVLYPYLQQY